MQLVTITERTQSGEAIMYCSHSRVKDHSTTHYQRIRTTFLLAWKCQAHVISKKIPVDHQQHILLLKCLNFISKQWVQESNSKQM